MHGSAMHAAMNLNGSVGYQCFTLRLMVSQFFANVEAQLGVAAQETSAGTRMNWFCAVICYRHEDCQYLDNDDSFGKVQANAPCNGLLTMKHYDRTDEVISFEEIEQIRLQ